MKTLILAPHPDDEILGALPFLEKGECHVVLFTPGDRPEQRMKEFKKSAQHFGFTYDLLPFMDGKLDELCGAPVYMKKLEHYAKSARAVVLPYEHDEHRDHKVVGKVYKGLSKFANAFAYSHITPFETTDLTIRLNCSQTPATFTQIMEAIYPSEFLRLKKDGFPHLIKTAYEYLVLSSY